MLRRSRDFVCLYVYCVCVLAMRFIYFFWAIVTLCTYKHLIVNIMKVYIERNNMQVELIRFRKNIDFIDVGSATPSSMGTSHRNHRPHIKVGKDAKEEGEELTLETSKWLLSGPTFFYGTGLIAVRDVSPLFCARSVQAVSIKNTSTRQFYCNFFYSSSLRFRLSRSTCDREWTKRLVNLTCSLTIRARCEISTFCCSSNVPAFTALACQI